MHMKTFCRVCKHPRSRPLLRPQTNTRENSFVAAHKLTKDSPMTLRINLSGENFHTRNPSFIDVALLPIRGQKLGGLDASLRELLRKRARAIVASAQCL